MISGGAGVFGNWLVQSGPDMAAEFGKTVRLAEGQGVKPESDSGRLGARFPNVLLRARRH
jgi:hypothetical protein